MEIAQSFAKVPRSGVRAILERASARAGTLHLELGDPDFATPEHIVEAALAAARSGFTHYTPSAGLPSLRAAAADIAGTRLGVECSDAMVTITTGACGGLSATLRVLLDPGDEVLVPDPGWTGYSAIAGTLGGVARPYPLSPQSSTFVLDAGAIEERVTPKTRAIVLNVPGNPAGNVATREQIASVVALAERRGIWLVADEAYEAFAYDGEQSLAGSTGSASVVSVFTCSKTYAMTGWRIGYVVAPREIASSVARAQEAMVTCASSISQKAAEAALTGPQDSIAAMRTTYRDRVATVTAALHAANVMHATPHGAFYVLVGVGTSSTEFATRLLDEHGVAVVPGSAFGSAAEGTVRVSACVAAETLAEGVRSIIGALRDEVAA